MEKSITSMINTPEIYNGKQLWEYHHSLGKAASRNKLWSYAMSAGMFDPEKGEPSAVGPLYAMWRYAYEHPKEAYPAWKKWAEESAHIFVANEISISYETFIKEVAGMVKRYRIRSNSNVVDAWVKQQLQKA